MPRKALRPCPRCRRNLTRERYCKECGGNAGWSTTSRHERGYGKTWDRLRKQAMARDKHLCQPCSQNGHITEATEVDHILNKARGGTDHLSNLQAICKPCHDAKTQREGGRGGSISGGSRA